VYRITKMLSLLSLLPETVWAAVDRKHVMTSTRKGLLPTRQDIHHMMKNYCLTPPTRTVETTLTANGMVDMLGSNGYDET
jgi:hypothetical protein